MVYVSITGFRVHSSWLVPRFFWHAVPSMAQAKRSDGNVSADAVQAGGVYHTLTVWTSRPHMLAFLTSGAHMRAMQAFPHIGTGFGFGFEADVAPSTDNVHRLWVAEEARRAGMVVPGVIHEAVL